MSKENQSTIDSSNSRLVLRDDLVFAPQRSGGNTVVHIECKGKSKFFRIGYSEYVFVSLLDGTRTFAQALAMASQELGSQALKTEEANELYLWLIQNKLGSLQEHSNESEGSSGRSASFKVAQKLNPFWMKFPFGSPKQLVRPMTKAFGWMFSATAVSAGLIFITIACFLAFTNWAHISNFSSGVFAPSNWLSIFAAWMLLKIVHESAHAVSANRYGADVDDCGVVMVLFAPMAYVDITSAWRLLSKWQRINIALAGIYAELLIASGAIFAMLNCESIVVGQALFSLFITAGLSTVLFNANPLMRFDGYFAISDFLEIPNLYQEGSKVFKRQVRRIFFGPWFKRRESDLRFGGSKRREVFVGVYGWLSAVWRVVICVSLAITASVLWEGAGIVLAFFGIIMWFGPSGLALFREMAKRLRSNSFSLVRPVLTASVFIAVGWSLLQFSPPPISVSVPAVVEYANVVHIRSASSAFVKEIHVRDGQKVAAGDLLLVLENEDVRRQYEDLRLQVEQAQLRRSMAIQAGEVAEAHVEQGNISSLENRMREAKRRYDGLTIRAPKAGKVVCRNLKQRVERHVPEGASLLSIGDERRKELVILLAQHDLDRVAARIGQKVSVVGGLFNRHQGMFSRLQPRASKKLTHTCLAATEGGPLPVTQVSNSSDTEKNFELVEPRFKGVISLDGSGSKELYCGQRVSVLITNGTDNLGSWIAISVRGWIKKKLQEAK